MLHRQQQNALLLMMQMNLEDGDMPLMSQLSQVLRQLQTSTNLCLCLLMSKVVFI